MIENLRGRSTETKYGRIPLWLYETGVGLQAIATYGWLHGRYGHYERVMPSYATLAKELKVSRGSVIAYVKELVSVGAVRIETSGTAGQQTNLYVIAFNEPFAVAKETAGGGQNADHPVSGLYRSGQNADPGGQRAVHEEDVLKKTKKTLSPPAAPKPRPAPPVPLVEREIAAAPDKPTAAASAPAGVIPGPRATDGQDAVDTAKGLLAGLPARLGKATVTRLAPIAAAAFADGWTVETLRAELDRRVHLPSIRNKGVLPGLYERALSDLPPAPPARSAGGRERCPDHPARYRRACVDCVMAVPA